MLNRKRLVTLHLGAHKTATTYIQSQLELNVNSLQRQVSYIPLKVMREKITEYVSNEIKFTSQKNKISQFVNSYSLKENLVISDENLLGVSKLLKNGQLYSDVFQRCKRIKSLFCANTQFKVVFSYRDYSKFITSMYIEYLRHNDYCKFDCFSKNINYELLNWKYVHNELSRAFGSENVVMYNFDKFDERGFISEILGCEIDFKFYSLTSSGVRRSTPSRGMIDLLDLAYEEFGGGFTKKLFSFIERNEVGNNSKCNLAYSEKLTIRYAKDIEELLGNLDD